MADDVELRGMIPRKLADVLDAVSSAHQMTRNALAEQVLVEWAERQLHVAMKLHRVTGGQWTLDGAPSVKRPDR